MMDRDDERPAAQGADRDEPLAHTDHAEGAAERLDLDEEERLPWLESIDDEDDYDGADSGRLLLVLIAGLVVLAALVGGIWWASHRGGREALQADGTVIQAPKTPYKEAPKTPGGKTFA